ADVALAELLQEHDSVGADPGAARGERSDRLAILEVGSGAVSRVEHDEIVPRPGHLIEVLAYGIGSHQILPVRLHQRRRQTIQIASRTIFFHILLTPSVRSTKMIGISTIRNPRFQARNDISIWNA